MKYEALDPLRYEIRILLLLPSRRSRTRIRCRMIHQSLDDPDIEYEALSYVWGSPQPAQQIRVNGTGFHVGPNLHSALQHLRLKDKIRRLWVDAVCINQRDNAEKSVQVAQMGRVFAQASQTNAWLGKQEDVRLAMRLLRLIAKKRMRIETLCGLEDETLDASWVMFTSKLKVDSTNLGHLCR